MKCPNCTIEVQNQNVNVQTDVAQCQGCNSIFKVSENIDDNNATFFDINHPPKGTWVNYDMNRIIIGATTRSPLAFFLVPFMLIWSGGSIGTIYGAQLVAGKFDPFESLVGLPFLIGSLIFWSIALMAIWGKVEITLTNQGGKVFTGLGKIGITKKFSWNEISTVKETQSNTKYPGSKNGAIQLEGKRRISFGIGVKESRRYYLFRAIQSTMAKVKTNTNFA